MCMIYSCILYYFGRTCGNRFIFVEIQTRARAFYPPQRWSMWFERRWCVHCCCFPKAVAVAWLIHMLKKNLVINTRKNHTYTRHNLTVAWSLYCSHRPEPIKHYTMLSPRENTTAAADIRSRGGGVCRKSNTVLSHTWNLLSYCMTRRRIMFPGVLRVGNSVSRGAPAYGKHGGQFSKLVP